MTEQTVAGFARAAEILEELEAAGVGLPSFRLFSDASGTLSFGRTTPTQEQMELATRLVRSERRERTVAGEYIISFCGGLTYTPEEDDDGPA